MRTRPRMLSTPVALALFGALLASACGGLDPDELPEEIGSGEREEIADVLAAFFSGVNRDDVQVASEVMLTPGELGLEEYARLVIQIGAFTAADVDVGFRSVGAAAVNVPRAVVEAVAVTDLGPVSFELVRRGGRWRLARVPDLQLPPEFAPHALEWRVTNSYASNDGETFTIVGRIDNTGDETVLQLGTPGFIRDEAGQTLRTELSALTARPFVHPGEHTHFRLDFQLPPGSTPDLERFPDRFVLVPIFRVSHPDDEGIMARGLSVAPRRLTLEEAAAGATVELVSGQFGATNAVVIAYAVAADGRVLSLYEAATAPIPAGGRKTLALPPPDRESLPDADRVEVEIWGTIPQR